MNKKYNKNNLIVRFYFEKKCKILKYGFYLNNLFFINFKFYYNK